MIGTSRPHAETLTPAPEAKSDYVSAFAVAAATAVAVTGFFLLPYFRRGLHYPLGWDAPFYIWRAELVSLEGLAGNGVVRSASPLLLAVLSRMTGQSAWTLVALLPPIMASVASLGGAAMARAAL
ncbi:MAG TPA: hypothetical protein VF660_00015, partial [Actinomycetota bacterium]